jgi:hypothetical protein
MSERFVLPCCIAALIVGASLFMQTATNNALARCENRGGNLTECRLVVLGR